MQFSSWASVLDSYADSHTTVIIIKRETTHIFHIASILLFYLLQRNYLNKAAYYSKVC
jgi:hypothetical protein